MKIINFQITIQYEFDRKINEVWIWYILLTLGMN